MASNLRSAGVGGQEWKDSYVAAWMGGELRGQWIHAYVWLSPFAVHLLAIVNWLYPNTKVFFFFFKKII